MSERCQDTLCCRPEDLKQAMSIHTRKITDSCRDKDCIEDLRVYLTKSSQALLDSASHARVRHAELLHAAIEVEPMAFDRKHYCIDVTFYYRITAEAVNGCSRPVVLTGLSVFSKRAVLCGEDGQTHTFRSDCAHSMSCPAAIVEVLDPMVLGSKVKQICSDCCQDPETVQIPCLIRDSFEDEFVLHGDRKRLFVTLGQFSIIRLEREAQLVVPVLDYSIPTRECCEAPSSNEDPCELFSKIPFPAGRFEPRTCDKGQDCYKTT